MTRSTVVVCQAPTCLPSGPPTLPMRTSSDIARP